MVYTEFRIPLPVTCEEFKRGQLYSIIDLSLKNSGGGEGVEWIKNEEYNKFYYLDMIILMVIGVFLKLLEVMYQKIKVSIH